MKNFEDLDMKKVLTKMVLRIFTQSVKKRTRFKSLGFVEKKMLQLLKDLSKMNQQAFSQSKIRMGQRITTKGEYIEGRREQI